LIKRKKKKERKRVRERVIVGREGRMDEDVFVDSMSFPNERISQDDQTLHSYPR
jgi:hypothetical protein